MTDIPDNPDARDWKEGSHYSEERRTGGTPEKTCEANIPSQVVWKGSVMPLTACLQTYS